VAEVPAAPDMAWLDRHGWAWDPARLDELILACAPATSLPGSATSQFMTPVISLMLCIPAPLDR